MPSTSRRPSRLSTKEQPNRYTTVSDEEPASPEPGVLQVTTRRTATVYDAVAGRVGLNGFLSQRQPESTESLASKPEDVLFRRLNAPDQIPTDYYDADQRLTAEQDLPDSDLLKAIHTFTSDFYAANTEDHGMVDFRSFDETALLALGILLEEASREAIGGTGDMALVEPEGLEDGLPSSPRVQYQVIGKVIPKIRRGESDADQDSTEDELLQAQSPRKRRRA